MAADEERLIKLEVIWILGNLACGTKEDIFKILNPIYGILPAIDIILKTPDELFLEQILWFIGNVCGEAKEFQEIVISNTRIFSVFGSLAQEQRIPQSLLKTLGWVNSNFSRYKNLNEMQTRIVASIAKAGLLYGDITTVSDSL